MKELNEDDKKNLSKFIEYSLSLIIHGFDEMEMEKRLELVKLTANTLNIFVEKTYGRMLDLEKRVEHLEAQISKKK